jgi:hypothetical protein
VGAGSGGGVDAQLAMKATMAMLAVFSNARKDVKYFIGCFLGV